MDIRGMLAVLHFYLQLFLISTNIHLIDKKIILRITTVHIVFEEKIILYILKLSENI